ncbi:phage terminase small subunit [Sphingomonas jinjuensis]|uniref:Phage terminase small subunit n=1 Tax=Sphingomonas jinjuensis TaxID=535907 RepID=A0A840F0U2_9SPHN|nr:P27 family phage terminase small subunit [Sphingomonas jinjuensis]MBB4152913.1 phage terminase small subunit [Sphingomonas jinjuensis]
MASGGARPGAGPKRRDPALGLTAAARKEIAVAGHPSAMMVAPIHLSDYAQLMFREIADLLAAQGRADPAFTQITALLAQRFEQIQRWQAVLEITGDTCTSTTVKRVDGEKVVTEMIRARPEVAMLSEAMRHAQSLLGDLMLSPSAALKLASGKKEPVNEFGDF